MKTEIKTKSALFFIYLAVAFLIFMIGLNAGLTERIYANGLYPIISVIQRFITSFLPFAIGDLLYLSLIFYIIRWLFIRFTKKDFTKDDFTILSIQTGNFLLLLYITFKLCWGLNYSRPSISTKLGIDHETYQREQLIQLSNFLLKKLKVLSPLVNDSAVQTNYTLMELEDKAIFTFQKLAKDNSVFNYRFASVKPVLNSWLVSKMGIEGYYNPLSGEANINDRLPAFVLPFITCHEIAHQLGIAREDEANLIGYIAAINSPDVHFQYAAYYSMFKSVLFEIRLKYPDNYNLILENIPSSVITNFKTERAFWMQYNGNMSRYMNKTFDKILKLNNQKKGIDSYQDIVLWLYNYHKHEL
ncbi:DUF3810 domain-containing protein [Pedobacter sp. ASV28]|uniref:DUF3810 domain-containing protein n=1 Tax=Pedobacter sp. ASV28 TaxID=2795123 RepID=UPI0018EB945E|nr:DUF3810 domain-containing protein [Pedobacter sp. ASV28]